MGDAVAWARRRPWLAVAVALVANYSIIIGRAVHEHRWLERFGAEVQPLRGHISDLLPLGHLWTAVILLAVLAAWRGRAWPSAVPAMALLGGPWAIDLVRTGRVVATPLCCTGIQYDLPWLAALEAGAMLLMVVVPVVAVRRRPIEPIGHAFFGLGIGVVAVPATAIVVWLALISPEGRLDSYTIAAAIAGFWVGVGIGAGGAPWIVAIMPAAWLWGLLPLHTAHDGAVGIVVLIGSLATSAALHLQRGFDPADPTHHRQQPDQSPLASTTS